MNGPLFAKTLWLSNSLLLSISFFAAQAGASRVIAVEASEKMAAVATQVNYQV